MKNILFGVLVLALGFTFSTAGFGQDKTKTEQKKEVNTKTEDKKETVKGGVFNTVCPVSGEEIDPEKTYTYNGVTYALCCNSCLKKFKADPDKYVSRLSEDGKSLKKKQ